MPDTYSSTSAANADSQLPPLTAKIRRAWFDGDGIAQAAVQPIANDAAMRGLLDAVHALELRVITLEGGTFP